MSSVRRPSRLVPRRSFLAAAALSASSLAAPQFVRTAMAEGGDPDRSGLTIQGRVPMLAMDGSFPSPPPPPPPPPPAIGPTRPQWDQATLLQVVQRHNTSEPLAALTFDDGWYARGRILDVLKSRGAHATFFLLGLILEQDPAFIRRALDEGHEFGNHTFDHQSAVVAYANGTLPSQLNRSEAALQAAAPSAQLRPYFRPPGGGYNADVVRVAAANGYRTIMWSVDPQDWRLPLSPARVVPYTEPGAIVLNHLTNTTADRLGEIIDQLQAQKGIRFVTLSELFAT